MTKVDRNMGGRLARVMKESDRVLVTVTMTKGQRRSLIRHAAEQGSTMSGIVRAWARDAHRG